MGKDEKVCSMCGAIYPDDGSGEDVCFDCDIEESGDGEEEREDRVDVDELDFEDQ